MSKENKVKSCKTICVANQKGGVAKTTTVLNLAKSLSEKGKKVLVVDADPQGSLTICSGVDISDNYKFTTFTLMVQSLEEDDEEEIERLDVSEFIVESNGVDIIPCHIGLSAFETLKSYEIGSERALEKAIKPLKEIYDYIIIDTTPYLGVLTINAITASDSVLITVSPQLLSAVGLKLLLKTIKKVKVNLNPQVNIEGVLLTMCDIRTNLFKEVKEIVESFYKDKVDIFETVIPLSTKVGEANMFRKSILEYDSHSKPSQAYRDFATELINRVEI